jgi:F-box/leucine-rich repeat protein 14
MDETHLMLTEIPGPGLFTHHHLTHHHPHQFSHHRAHQFHRYTPYHLHQTHLPPTPAPPIYFTNPQQTRISLSHHVTMRPKTPLSPPTVSEGTHISDLYPEILTMIFSQLSIREKGRAAQVCTAFRDACYNKSVWKGVEAKLHLRRSSPTLFSSLVKRGIRNVQILSLRRTLKDVVVGVTNLESLNLSGCYNVTDVGLGHAFAQDLPNLKTLDLSLCKQVTDSSLGRIAQHLKNLEVLELGGCSNITNTGLLLIAWGLKKLKRLNLRSCWHISDQGIGHLAGLSKETAEGNLALEYLGLQDCQRLSDESLKHIAQGLVSLKNLNLSFCISVTDSGLKYLSKMPKLEELNLRACDNISDIGMAGLAEEGCCGLESLDVSFCEKIGDQALQHISQGLYHLKSLSLSSCQISDEGLEKLAKMKDLQVLNVGQCSKITDKGLEVLANELINLNSIDLYGCTKISSKGIEIIMKLPKLKSVNLGLWLVR